MVRLVRDAMVQTVFPELPCVVKSSPTRNPELPQGSMFETTIEPSPGLPDTIRISSKVASDLARVIVPAVLWLPVHSCDRPLSSVNVPPSEISPLLPTSALAVSIEM